LALPANEKDSKQAQFIFLERFFRDGGSIKQKLIEQILFLTLIQGRSASLNPFVPPQNAVSALNVDSTVGSWQIAGTSSTSLVTEVIASPSLDGAARRVSFSFTNSGNARVYTSVGTDSTSTNFVLDYLVRNFF
jgi:hypothetical protein